MNLKCILRYNKNYVSNYRRGGFNFQSLLRCTHTRARARTRAHAQTYIHVEWKGITFITPMIGGWFYCRFRMPREYWGGLMSRSPGLVDITFSVCSFASSAATPTIVVVEWPRASLSPSRVSPARFLHPSPATASLSTTLPPPPFCPFLAT